MRTIRFTFFPCQPRGYAVYDEITHKIMSYHNTRLDAIRKALDLNGITAKDGNHKPPNIVA